MQQNIHTSFNKIFSYLKFLTISIGTIISWQSIAYAASVNANLLYIYLLTIIFFHIPNLVFIKYLLNNNQNVVLFVNSKLGYKSAVFMTLTTWVSNIVYYPATFTFILSNLSIALNYKISNSEYVIGNIILYLIMSFINLRGFNVSLRFILWLSSIGIIVPILVLSIFFGYYVFNHYYMFQEWLFQTQIDTSFQSDNIDYHYILAIIMGVIGFEQISLHSNDIIKGKFKFKNWHFIFMSLIIILLTLWMTLVIAYFLSIYTFNANFIIAGIIMKFFDVLGYPLLGKCMIIMFIIGILGNTFSWMIHINRSFNTILLITKSSHFNFVSGNFVPVKLIKYELVVFILYYILLQIFPALQTSVILYSISSQLVIIYHAITYMAILKDKEIIMGISRFILIIGLLSYFFTIICFYLIIL